MIPEIMAFGQYVLTITNSIVGGSGIVIGDSNKIRDDKRDE